jgi:predicted pyridoxine 5'-phosphate oxidase superfamily flavin-nucleotide-binding protein
MFAILLAAPTPHIADVSTERMTPPSSDIAFTPSVKRLQQQRGSRELYARVEAGGGFETDVTDVLRAFLAQVDTAFLATATADGQPYVQHRGGPKGFIRAIDDRTLAFVDFVGNQQHVTTGNLEDNDRVCLFLIDYARRKRVKVWGTARVVPATEALLAQLMPAGYRARPQQVVAIAIAAWDINCPQHIPQKLDADEVAAVIARLESRIVELEAENRKLQTER